MKMTIIEITNKNDLILLLLTIFVFLARESFDFPEAQLWAFLVQYVPDVVP